MEETKELFCQRIDELSNFINSMINESDYLWNQKEYGMISILSQHMTEKFKEKKERALKRISIETDEIFIRVLQKVISDTDIALLYCKKMKEMANERRSSPV